MPKKNKYAGLLKQTQGTKKVNVFTRGLRKSKTSYWDTLYEIRRQTLSEKEDEKEQPINFGGVEVRVKDQVDKTDRNKKSRKFLFKAANKPTVTIVDNDPDNPGITGTIKVLGVTYALNLTLEQINEVYGEVISNVTSERLKME